MAYNRTVTITGLNEVLKGLEAYGDKVRIASADALHAEASEIMADSKANYVPVDLGGLRDSGKVSAIEQSGDRASVTLYYDAPYAAAIHENPRAGHTGGMSPSGRRYLHWATTGGWKFLESAVLAAESGMLGRIASRIRSSVAGHVAGGP